MADSGFYRVHTHFIFYRCVWYEFSIYARTALAIWLSHMVGRNNDSRCSDGSFLKKEEIILESQP